MYNPVHKPPASPLDSNMTLLMLGHLLILLFRKPLLLVTLDLALEECRKECDELKYEEHYEIERVAATGCVTRRAIQGRASGDVQEVGWEQS
jgi:hypothetical protein